MPSKDNNDLLGMAAKMLVSGESTEQARLIKQSAEARIGEPLRKLIVHHLGEHTDLPCPKKKEIANEVVEDFYKQMEL